MGRGGGRGIIKCQKPKVQKNNKHKSGNKFQKKSDLRRNGAKYPGITYPGRRRTLSKLSLSFTKVYPGITDENTHKTHRVTESARDIILTNISPRFNWRLMRNVQGHGIVPKSEQ